MSSLIIDEVEFKQHPIYLNYYGSRNGLIYSSITDKLLSDVYNNDNYLQVHLYRNGTTKMYKVHRFIYECFHGVIPNNLTIDHVNRDKEDNRLDNLRLATYSENNNNRKPSASKIVNNLPEDAEEIEYIQTRKSRYEFAENTYYYSKSNDKVYWIKGFTHEIIELKTGENNKLVRMLDISNNGVHININTIKKYMNSDEF